MSADSQSPEGNLRGGDQPQGGDQRLRRNSGQWNSKVWQHAQLGDVACGDGCWTALDPTVPSGWWGTGRTSECGSDKVLQPFSALPIHKSKLDAIPANDKG